MRVVFLCTGNVCRSPLAEHLLRDLLASRGVNGIECTSAGLFATPGAAVLPEMQRAARDHQLDLSAHRARRIARGDVHGGDLVFVMEENHRRQTLSMLELEPGAVHLLGRFVSDEEDEIADPLGGPPIAFDRCFDRLAASIARLATRLEDASGSRD